MKVPVWGSGQAQGWSPAARQGGAPEWRPDFLLPDLGSASQVHQSPGLGLTSEDQQVSLVGKFISEIIFNLLFPTLITLLKLSWTS